MKALTIRNPWAAAVLLAEKDVENRTWRCPTSLVGSRVLVHAGKAYDARAKGAWGSYSGGAIHRLPLADRRGELLGSVRVVDCVASEDCQLPWSQQVPGGWAWLLDWPLIWRRPVPCRGALGLFEPVSSDGRGLAAVVERFENEAMDPADWWRWDERRRMAGAEGVGSPFD